MCSRPTNDALAIPPKWLFERTPDDLARVFSRAYSADAAAANTGFAPFFFNAVFVGGTGLLLTLVIGTRAAYGFPRYPLRGDDTCPFITLTTRMRPPIVVIIQLSWLPHRRAVGPRASSRSARPSACRSRSG